MSITGTVGERATPLADYPHIRDTDTLRDVFATLRAKYDSAEQFRSVLVLDAQDRLIGLLGLRDLLHGLLPEYLRHHAAHYEGAQDNIAPLAALWQDDCVEQCRIAARHIAREFATPVRTTAAADDPLSKAVYLFATLNLNAIPVTEGGRVVGVLRIVDILSEVADTILHEGDPA